MTRSTVILLILAVAGCTLVALLERARPMSAAATTARVTPIFAPDELDVDDVTRIELERDGERFVFERDDNAWMQLEPVAYPMTAYSMRRLAILASGLESAGVVDASAADAAALGLDPPRAVLRISAGEASWTLELGRLGIGGRAYIRRAGSDVIHVVDQSLHERVLVMRPSEWRERRLFMTVGAGTNRIEIERADGTLALESRDRRWRLTSPVRARADAAAVDQLLDALARAEGAGFILDEPDDLEAFGLATPAGRVRVEGVQQRIGEAEAPVSETLLVGERMGAGSQDRFGMMEGRPVVIRIPEAVLRAFFGPSEQFVAATASGVQPSDIKQLRISTDAGEFAVERDIDRWVFSDDTARPARTEMVEGLLRVLLEVRPAAVQFARFPGDSSVGYITLIGYDRMPIDTVRIARVTEGEGEGGWILENGDGVLRIHPASIELPLGRAVFE